MRNVSECLYSLYASFTFCNAQSICTCNNILAQLARPPAPLVPLRRLRQIPAAMSVENSWSSYKVMSLHGLWYDATHRQLQQSLSMTGHYRTLCIERQLKKTHANGHENKKNYQTTIAIWSRNEIKLLIWTVLVNQNVLSNYLYFYDYSKLLYVISGKIHSLVSTYAWGRPMVIDYVQPSLIFIGHYN